MFQTKTASNGKRNTLYTCVWTRIALVKQTGTKFWKF